MSDALPADEPASQRAELVLRLPSGEPLRVRRVPAEAFTSPPLSSLLVHDEGLAYVLSPPRRVGFWTLGFEQPVDQVFIAPNGRVVQVLEARAAGEGDLVAPATELALVLELAGGAARRLGILPGAIVAEGGPSIETRDAGEGLSRRPEGLAQGHEAVGHVPIFDTSADPGFIAIVQSDRAGWFLACELRRRGYRIAHVHHTQHLDEVGEDEFDVELVYGEDLDDVLPALGALGPSLVLAGSELGVNPADYLAEALCLPTNGTLRSVARRDKAGMVDALRAARIPVMRQLRSRSWKRIVRWMQRHDLREVVIKPVRSAGTDRVSCARTPDEVKRATRAIIGATNRLGLREVEVVAQERLFGPEIYLNTVSRAGRHALTEIWLETKREARGGGAAAPFAYDTFELLPGDDVLAGYLWAWLERVLDALGVAWGPAHTELILTSEGPRLIDFGARLDGVLLPSLNEECIGRSPVQITADAYLDPVAWEAWAAAPYRLRQRATMVVVDNPCAGILRDDRGLRDIARLPTFHALRPRWGVGADVPVTRDAFSYHAIITLRDPDLDAVRRDHATIRELEAAELLLDVTPAAPEPAGDAAPTALTGFRFSDPRALDAWGRALEPFGWTTVRDPPTGLVGRLRADRDGPLLWLPRQSPSLSLLALERLRLATNARRVIVELLPGTRVVPLIGAEVVVSAWDSEVEAALEVVGLTPTMHAQAPPLIELATASEADDSVVIRPLAEAGSGHAIESAFRALGGGATASWPAALGASFAGEAPCALALLDRDGALVGAALGLVHESVVHVPVASATHLVDLQRLALALGAHFRAPVIAPGTGISRRPDGLFLALPPALRWKRPAWAEHLTTIDGLADAVGLPASPANPTGLDLATRLSAREHPLATWGGAAIGQALGRMPVWTRTAMLFREAPGEAAHGVVPHAQRIDLGAFDAIANKQSLLWIGWEPPPAGGEVVTSDGRVHTIRWDDPARALHEAAALGLYPVRARWTHRKTLVLDLATADLAAEPAADSRSESTARVAVTPVSALGPGEWRRLDELADGCVDGSRTMFPHGRRAARGLALGLGDNVVCALAEDAEGIVAVTFCVLHDRVAWSLLSNIHPRASADTERELRSELMRHARAAGCDLMDLHGAWDERFPDEHALWRRTPDEGGALLAKAMGSPSSLLPEASGRRLAMAHPVYYPPTLARFRA